MRKIIYTIDGHEIEEGKLIHNAKRAYEILLVQNRIMCNGKVVETPEGFTDYLGEILGNERAKKLVIKWNHDKSFKRKVKIQQMEWEITMLKEHNKRLNNAYEEVKESLKEAKDSLREAKADTDKERYIQIIRILSEAFKRYTHLPSATAALEWSKEAETVPYKDMKILEMILEDIERGVKGYED